MQVLVLYLNRTLGSSLPYGGFFFLRGKSDNAFVIVSEMVAVDEEASEGKLCSGLGDG